MAVPDPKNSNTTVSFFKDSNNSFVASIDIFLVHNLSQVFALYNFSIPKDKNDNDYGKLITKRNMDICRLATAKTTVVDKIRKLLIDEIEKHADYEVKCPFSKVIKINCINLYITR